MRGSGLARAALILVPNAASVVANMTILACLFPAQDYIKTK